jgi:putative membrane protein
MSTRPALLPGLSDRGFYVAVTGVSIAALGLLTYLLVLRTGNRDAGRLAFMPVVNASLNGTSAVLIVLGYASIKARRRELHKRFMLGALGASTLFLLGYVAYHAVHGDTKYPGSGGIRTFYLAMLASHVILSAVALPLTLTAFFFALRKSFARHKKVVKYALPIWLYVSVTGVAIYVMLRQAGAVG